MHGKFGMERGMVTSVNEDSSSVVVRHFQHFSFLGMVDICCSVLQSVSHRPILTHSTDTEQLQSNDVDIQ